MGFEEVRPEGQLKFALCANGTSQDSRTRQSFYKKATNWPAAESEIFNLKKSMAWPSKEYQSDSGPVLVQTDWLSDKNKKQKTDRYSFRNSQFHIVMFKRAYFQVHPHHHDL